MTLVQGVATAVGAVVISVLLVAVGRWLERPARRTLP